MIEINLLPGAAKKSKNRGTGGFNVKALTANIGGSIKDPYLVTGLSSLVVAIGAIATMHLSTGSKLEELKAREASALRDSTRFAMIIRDRRKAEAKRDSLVQQLAVIRAIDNDRFVWPHIMDEVSRALPPYTWLKSIAQTSGVTAPSGVAQPAVASAAAPTPPPTSDNAGAASPNPVPEQDHIKLKIVGNTVDIQALTRFMKLLETSPFLQRVQLARSELVVVDGREVTEFQLDAEYERADKSMITTVPVTLTSR